MVKRFEALNEQIEKTMKRLEAGEIQKTDRVFLHHILEELERLVDAAAPENAEYFDVAEGAYELIGSTNELIEDGLDAV